MHRVVLSGRPSRFPGLSDRFAAEVIPMFPKSPVKVKFVKGCGLLYDLPTILGNYS